MKKLHPYHGIREAAGADWNTPVRIVEGDAAPHQEGEAGYHTTRSGKTRIRYINAYRRKGFYTIYHHSTLEVIVGRKWIEKHYPRLFREGIKIQFSGLVTETGKPLKTSETPLKTSETPLK